MNLFFIGTKAECKAYIAKMDAMMGYPNPENGTTTYARSIPHSGKTGMFLVPIKEVWGPKLSRRVKISDMDRVSTIAERTTKRKTSETLKAEGAFHDRSQA